MKLLGPRAAALAAENAGSRPNHEAAPNLAMASKTNYPDLPVAIDFDSIRRANPLAGYCEAHGIRLHRSGSRLVGKCPLHDERNGRAFVVHPDGKWQCYGKCNRSGDVVDLERALHGGTVREAAERLGGTVTPAPIASRPKRDNRRKPTKENPLALPYVLSDEERVICRQFAHNLLNNKELIALVAASRGWKSETIERLAAEGCLGRDDENRTALITEAGCRSRWNTDDGQKHYFSHFGKNWLWRGELIAKAETVYLTEGEPDAITLVDTGIEDDGKTAVVAVQAAIEWAVGRDSFGIHPARPLKTLIIQAEDDEGDVIEMSQICVIWD